VVGVRQQLLPCNAGQHAGLACSEQPAEHDGQLQIGELPGAHAHGGVHVLSQQEEGHRQLVLLLSQQRKGVLERGRLPAGERKVV
jgi:hypothetical protein